MKHVFNNKQFVLKQFKTNSASIKISICTINFNYFTDCENYQCLRLALCKLYVLEHKIINSK